MNVTHESTQQYRPTTMIISLSTLAKNVSVLKHCLGRSTRMMAVVKADAYGHGMIKTANVALENGADCLAVALVEEAVALRAAGIHAPVLVMGAADECAFGIAVRKGISLTVFTPEAVRRMQQSAKALGKKAWVHLKVDTGMTRIGVRGDKALDDVLQAFADSPDVIMEGMYSHCANADDDKEYTMTQAMWFDKAIERVRVAGFSPYTHMAASVAMLSYAPLHYDCVRPGIAIYGGEVTGLCPELCPAQTLITKPIRLQTIAAGDFVGYGCTFCAQRETVVCTLPIGYGDGYPRALSNVGQVLIRGRRANIIGRVCMDMCMIDVTDICGVTLEDEVVLMGAQGDERITPDELARLTGTIAYEIMLGFLPRVPRVYAP